jgi:hypothetical protein
LLLRRQHGAQIPEPAHATVSRPARGGNSGRSRSSAAWSLGAPKLGTSTSRLATKLA